MNKALLATAACAALGLAAAAQAAPVDIVLTPVATNPVGLNGTVGNGYTAYEVKLVAAAGNKISAADFSTVNAGQGINRGIFGPLLEQRKSNVAAPSHDAIYAGAGAVPATYADYTRDTDFNLDSYFVNYPSYEAPAGSGTFHDFSVSMSNGSEDFTTTTSIPASGTTAWRTGSFLRSTTSIAGEAQTNQHVLAYIVIPTGSVGQLSMNGSVSTAQGTFDATLAPVPEPATLGLAAVGACGLFARRRRA